jgi:hypothetical protein
MSKTGMMIYAFFDRNGDPFYFGKTGNFKNRRRHHIYCAKYRVYNYKHYNRLRKMFLSGLDLKNYILVIKNNISPDKIDFVESWFIKKYKKLGYDITNLTEGGEGATGFTPEMREKIRKAHIGTHHSDETKHRISEARKGIQFTKDHKNNLSKARRKRVVTKETRDKTSKTSKGNINIGTFEMVSPKGEVYITERGLTVFCEENGLIRSLMSKVSKGERKSHKGWKCTKIF